MSYEYLGKNVIPVKLCKEVGRVEQKVVQLSPKDEERAMRLHRESIIVDFHLHLKVLPEDLTHYELLARSGRVATGFEGIKRSGMTACFCAFGGSMGKRSSPTLWNFNDSIWDYGMRQADMDHHADVVSRGYSVKDILEAKQGGRCAVFPTIETAQVIENDLDRLDVLYGLGFRILGLGFNNRTIVADGLNERTDGGLSNFGFEVIERMNRLGMIIDLGHTSPVAIKDSVEASKMPCCLTHTFARGVYNTPRGASDDILQLIAKHGGLIGAYTVTNMFSNKEVQTVFDVIDHVDYMVKVVGVDHVAIGTDTMFGDHVGLHKLVMQSMHMEGQLKGFPAPYTDYIENAGQWPNVTRALVARGYSDEEIKKIIGGNILRFLKETIG